jgi:Uma2 family endonuclease
METAVQTIPDQLVYEVTDQGPIYYQGYWEYLNGTKTLEEIMGSSILQSSLVTDLVYALSALSKEFRVLSSELGIQLARGKYRAADIAIVRRDAMKKVKDKRKYLGFAPEVVIEVNIKAELETIEGLKDSLGYIDTKTKELFQFGVKKVIWVLTDTEKVVIAEAGQSWTLVDWDKDITVLEDCLVNVKAIVDEINA